MRTTHITHFTVHAKTLQVLPLLGLAYLIDDHQREWTLTRSTAGPGLQHLHPGQQLSLQVKSDSAYSLVVAYALGDAEDSALAGEASAGLS
ncbi:MAG: hypothetical protein AB9M53_01560 [Leptothrix sp. (in: b-proteobacteria)]